MALTKVVKHLSSTPSIVDEGNATAITINNSEEVTFADDIFVLDNKAVKAGAGGDLQILHDGTDSHIKLTTTGHLNIVNEANDKDIYFRSDDGSGGTTAYLYLDGSQTLTRFPKDIRFEDSVKARFGTDNDLQIYHDGSNSYIKNNTSQFYTLADYFNVKNNANDKFAIRTFPSDAVKLYFNNSEKLATSNTGVSITGTLLATIASASTASTQSAGDNTTKIATTAYTDAAITALIGGAPGTLNTLNEIAAAINDDANYVSTVNNLIGLKAPLASPNFTGQIQASNAASTIHELLVTNNNTRSTLNLQSKDSSGNAVSLRMHALGDGPRGEIFTYTNHALAFATNNAAPQMTLLTNGNFGIGNSSPDSKLDVVSGVSRNAGGTARFGKLADRGLFLHSDASTSSHYNWMITTQDTVNKGFEIIPSDSPGGTQFTTPAFVIKADTGNVGIGTTAPEGPLHVRGASNQIRIQDSTNDKKYDLNVDGNKFFIDDMSVGVNVFAISGTNVGIGTTNPTDPLVVQSSGSIGGGATNANSYFTVTDGTYGLYHDPNEIFSDINGVFHIGANHSNGVLRFQTGGTAARMDILANGNVGIGTTNPQDTLHVVTDSSTTNDTVDVVRIEATSSGTPAVGFGPAIDFRAERAGSAADSVGRLGFVADIMTASRVDGAFVVETAIDGAYTERLRIDSTGRAGIGRTPSIANSKLEVGGADNVSLINVEASGATGGMGIGSTGLQFFHGSTSTARMRIDSSGNVGIAKSSLTTWSSGYNSLQLGGRGFLGAHSGSDLYVGQNASFNSGWKYQAAVAASMTQHSGGQITHFIAPSGSAGAAITWTPALHIKTNSYVGLGTTNPSSLLHLQAGVTGSVGGSHAGITMANLYDNVDNIWVIQPARSGVSNTGLEIRDVTDSRSAMSFDGDGNVGIGTPSPSTKLTVKNDSAATSQGANNIITIQNANTTDNSRMGLAFTGNTGIGSGLALVEAQSYDQSAGHTSLNFSVYNGSWHTDMMVLKGGMVGIGVSDPDHKLEISAPSGSGGLVVNSNGASNKAIRINQLTNDDWIGEFIHTGGTNAYGININTMNGNSNNLAAFRIYTPGDAQAFYVNNQGRVNVGGYNPQVEFQIGDYTDATETMQFATSSNGTAKINFYDNNSTEGGFIQWKGETYGGNMTIGPKWNSEQTNITIRLRKKDLGGLGEPDTKIGVNAASPGATIEVRGRYASKDATDADDVIGNEEPVFMLRGANGGSVQEWVHSTKAVAPSGGTQTPMISWYQFNLPGGWSGTGTPGYLEISNQISGMHSAGNGIDKFMVVPSNSHSSIQLYGGLADTTIYRTFAARNNSGSYTTSLSHAFYFGNATTYGYAAGAIFMKVTHAAREPIFTMYAKYVGGTGNSRNYPQTMKFLGTESTNNHSPSNITQLSVTDGAGGTV